MILISVEQSPYYPHRAAVRFNAGKFKNLRAEATFSTLNHGGNWGWTVNPGVEWPYVSSEDREALGREVTEALMGWTVWKGLDMADADVSFSEKGIIDPNENVFVLNTLLSETDWRHDDITLFGKTHKVPRLHQWYARDGKTYRWSGITLTGQTPTDLIECLMEDASKASGTNFNSVMVNLYRDGNDTVGWHTDSELEFGTDPVITSLSLGEPRDFIFRNIANNATKVKISLTPGSLVMMRGSTQKHWQHTVPRRIKSDRPRINLTFRKIV